MRGPLPTPITLRALQGNPSKRRLPRPLEPDRGEQPPDAPAYLEGVAADEWYAVAEELWRLGILRVTDHTTLAAYCVAAARWRQAEAAIAEMAKDDQLTRRLLIKTPTARAGTRWWRSRLTRHAIWWPLLRISA